MFYKLYFQSAWECYMMLIEDVPLRMLVSWEELVLDGVHAVKMIWKPCFSKMFFKKNGYNNLFSFGCMCNFLFYPP